MLPKRWLSTVLMIGACRPATAPIDTEPAPASAPSVAEVVARESVAFDPPTPPPALVDALASHRVALLGEVHLLREHHAFVMATLEALHARGTRWLLLESFHANGRRADRFASGATDRLSPPTQEFFGVLLQKVRAFNETLDPEERVHVAFVDIDHAPSALPGALALDEVEGRGTASTRAFLQAVGWDSAAPWKAQQETFMRRWGDDPRRLRDALEALAAADETSADPWLAEAVEVAQESLEIKAVWAERGENAAHPLREEVIKRLVSQRAAASEATVLMNVGGYHVQRRHAMGTPKAWLAEHLADPRGPIGGSVYAVYVNVASAQQRVSGELQQLSIEEDPTELMWQLYGHADGRAAYLPLRDPVFASQDVKVHYLYRVLEHRPAEQFDAYVLLPRGTLLPSFAEP